MLKSAARAPMVCLAIALALALGIAPASGVAPATAAVCAQTPLPKHARLYVLGDSWSAGDYADPKRALNQVAAHLLGWQLQVNAKNGTGYLQIGDGGAATYPVRAGAISRKTHANVVIVQGGSNDWSKPIGGLAAAAKSTIARLRSAFPRAWVVLLGPGPDPFPASAKEHSIDAVLSKVARTSHATYISMLRERWITASNLDSVISPISYHPTVAGHKYLGHRLAADLRKLERHRPSVCTG